MPVSENPSNKIKCASVGLAVGLRVGLAVGALVGDVVGAVGAAVVGEGVLSVGGVGF